MSHLNRSRVSRIQLGTMMAVAVAGVTALAPYASAINYIKADNGNNNLNDVPAWTNNSGLPGAGDLAVFDSTLAGPANYSFNLGGSDTSWLGLSITNPATSITFTAGNLLTLGASGITVTSTAGNVTIANNVALGASQTWTNPTGRTLTVSGTIDLNTASNFTLTTNISGTASFGAMTGNASIIANSTGTATFSSISGFTSFVADGAGTTNLNGALTSTGTITKNGAGRLNLGANNSGFTGNFVINTGTLTATAANQLGGGTVILNGGGGTFNFPTNPTFANNFVINGSANSFTTNNTPQMTGDWSGSGTVTLNDSAGGQRIAFGLPVSDTHNQLTGFSGLIVLATAANGNKDGLFFNANTNQSWGNPNMIIDVGSSRISTQQGGTVTLGALRGGTNGILSGANGTALVPATYVVGSLMSSTFAGIIAGANGNLSLYKVGNTTLTLSNTSSLGDPLRGALNVYEGVVEFANASQLGADSSPAASNLLIGDTNGINTAIRYIGAGNASSTNRLFTTNSSATIEASGGVGNTLTFNNTGEIVPSQTGTTTITLGGSNTGLNTMAPSVNNGTTSAGLTVSLVKSGVGTWVLAGSYNGYTGSTTISGGTLYLNTNETGGLTGTSGVTATGTGSFGGQGVVAGPVAINGTGHLIVGVPGVNSGVGALSLNSGLTLAGGTGLDLEFIAGNNDVVNLNNSNLTFGGPIAVTARQGDTPFGFATLGTYNIFTNINVFSGSASNLSVVGGDPVTAYGFSKVGSSIILTVSENGPSWSGLGADNNWVNAATSNWFNNISPSATAFAIFGPRAANSSVNLNAAQTVGILSIDNGTHNSYNISSNNSSVLHLNAGTNGSFAQILHKSGSNQISAGISLDQPTTVSLTAGTTLTLSGAVGASSSANGLTVSGAGSFILTGNNTYTSSTTVSSGTGLIVGDSTNSGTIGNGSGGLVNNGVVSFNRTDAYSLTNPISGTGGVWNQIGTGTTTLSPAGNYTFGTFTMTSGVVHAGGTNLTNTRVSGGDLEGDLSRISGTMTIGAGDTGGVVNTNNATISAAITISSGSLNFNNDNVGTTLTNNGGTVDVLGHLDSFTSLSGSGGIIQNSVSGTPTTLVLSMAAATNTSYSGAINGALTLFLKNPAAGASGGTITLNQANNYTGKTVIGNLGETANSGGVIVVGANGALSNTEVDIFGKVVNRAILLGDGVNLSNNIVLNTNPGSAETLGVTGANVSATYSGKITMLSAGGTASNDIGNSSLRIGAATNGSITLSNTFLSSSSNASAQASVIVLRQGTVILDGATVNSYNAETMLGGGANGTVTLMNGASVTSNVGAGKEGGSVGFSNGNQGFLGLILNDTSKVDVGAANFNLLSAGNNTIATIALNGSSILKAGGFTRTGSNNTSAVRIFANGGTIVAGQSNPNFLVPSGFSVQASVVMTASGAGAIFDSNGFDIGVGIPIIHDPNFGFDGGLIKNGLGTLTYAGNIVGSATNSQYNGLTTVNGGALFFGASGTNNAYTLSNLSDVSATGAGTLGVGTGSTLTATGAILTGGLTVNGTAIMAAANGSNGSKVNALTIGGTSTTATGWTGKLDITDNTLVVQTANTTSKFTAMASLANQIVSGNNGGQWNGNGIIASRLLQDTTATSTLALIDNADLGLSSLGGQSLDSNSILLLRAELGDADLSGTVDLIDFDVWFAHLGFNTPSFAAGDFNTDGVVDLLDFDIWFSHLGFSGPNLTAGGTGAVPEPASLAMLALGSAALLTRRRRKM